MANKAVDYGPSGKKKTTYNTANLLKVSNSPALMAAQRNTAPTSGASSFGGAFRNAASVALNTARNAANSVGLQTSTPKNTGSGFGGALSNAANTVANTIRNVVSNAGYVPTGSTTPVTTNNTDPVNTSGGPTYSGNSGGSSSGSSSSGSSSGSSGGSSSGSSRKKVSTDFDSAPVYDATAVYQRYLDELRRKADSAYMVNMSRIGQAYDTSNANLRNNFDQTRSDLQSAYDRSARNARDDSEQALRESYINYMMNRRNLNQELSALGLTGGAAESTLGSILNNYGNSRNAIETTRNRNLADLGETYQDSLSKAESAYNTALNNLISRRLAEENAAENARQNMLSNFASNLSTLATSDNTYLDTLRSLRDQMGAVELAPTAATNTYEGANVQQGIPTPGEAGNAYARYLQQAKMMRDGGQSDDEIKNYLFSTVGNNANALSQIFAQLGLV